VKLVIYKDYSETHGQQDIKKPMMGDLRRNMLMEKLYNLNHSIITTSFFRTTVTNTTKTNLHIHYNSTQ